MKRNHYFAIILVAAAIILHSCNTGQNKESDSGKKSVAIEAASLNVDLAKSFLFWKGEMLGLYSHEGIINISEAELTVSDGAVASGSFTVDMSSITPTDEAYSVEEGRTKERLVQHLSSPDFFDVENHPVSTFTIKKVDGSSITGDLTIRGITHEETVRNVQISKESDESYKITGELTFDRTKYDVKFQMTLQDMVLSDDIQLKIELIAS
ncbi:MAG: YceI family protein [Bacteroidales bacterium]|nr:YceI family protein [Bacteroidales bacterium]MBN2697794.1 YceI family protein [Bacteroidales bacterium]